MSFHHLCIQFILIMLLQQYRHFCWCSALQLGQHYGCYNQRQRPALMLQAIRSRISSVEYSKTKTFSSSVKRKPVLSPYPHSSSLSGSSTKLFERKESANDNDTIYALSSGAGAVATAVAVIRLSGPQSLTILDMLMNHSSSTDKQQKVPQTRYAAVRNLYDPRDGSLLDQALVLTFQQPSSFTGEDVAELHCHGSRAVIQGVLDSLAYLGTNNHNIRPSERGEFTQRAFENGKLSLLQIEALADLILADTSLQRKQALNNLIQDRLSTLYNQWRIKLTKGLAYAEAIIDFGDDEDLSSSSGEDHQKVQQSIWGNVRQDILRLKDEMERHTQDNQRGEIIREGVKVAIIGPPNAGKSSLLNVLAKRDAAIVSPIAGTTRDVVEIIMDLGGVRCIVSDTAGIRETTEDVIEQEGIRRAKVAAMDAHVCVLVVDAADQAGATTVQTLVDNIATETLTHEASLISTTLGSSITNKNKIQPMIMLVSNKIDLVATLNNNYEALSDDFIPVLSRFGVSCTTGSGVDDFMNALTALVIKRVSTGENSSDDGDEEMSSSTVITRSRHRYHVQEAVEALKRFEEQSQQGLVTVDLAAEELRLAASELGRVVGAVDVEDVLDVLFVDFCIGK